jgi:branched-chain amino acid transport system ATP-binding protein
MAKGKVKAGEGPALVVDRINVFYGKVQILHEVSMAVEAGEIVTIIGPNGAGKSTTLKAIFGIAPVKGGRVVFEGKDITNWETSKLVNFGLSYIPQGGAIFPSLSVQENLEMGAFIRKDAKAVADDIEGVMDQFPILRERKDQEAGLMSGGEQQILALGRALMLSPKLMLLDEPSLGLAPKVVGELLDQIKEINKTGVTIIIVEQNASMALDMADRGYVLELGRNKLEGKGKDLLSDERVKRIYLGGI